jgi:hypothetical protein
VDVEGSTGARSIAAMATRLPRRTWVALLVLYAGAAVLLYAFTSVQVAPCLAGPAPDIQARCVATWLETRPIELKLLATPIPAIGLFATLVGVTWWLTRIRPRA